MDVEKQKNDDTSNVESLKRNNRLFLVGLIIVFCLMASGLVYQQREIISLRNDLKEVADSVKYDLNRHSNIDSDEELELKVDALMSTDWFKKRAIENSLDKKVSLRLIILIIMFTCIKMIVVFAKRQRLICLKSWKQ